MLSHFLICFCKKRKQANKIAREWDWRCASTRRVKGAHNTFDPEFYENLEKRQEKLYEKLLFTLINPCSMDFYSFYFLCTSITVIGSK